jgi:hypothetical protein
MERKGDSKHPHSERESFSTKHTHLHLLMRASPSKATTCGHRSICMDRLQPEKSQPLRVIGGN